MVKNKFILFKKYLSTQDNQKPMMISIAVIIISVFVLILNRPSSMVETEKSEDLNLDTYIPPGQVLVPIAVQNFESVDSIFGNHGVVDLYAQESSTGAPSLLVARAVKMLRAPKNPSQFGVLLPIEHAPQVVQKGGPFYVVIRNIKETAPTGIKIEKGSKTRPFQIIYDEDDE
ncbi:MAG: hypothetical protein K1X29_07990 [Bdellovibrionales bacterium]|nr:hypothetical protein [Bdellovibrionales bacterium]